MIKLIGAALVIFSCSLMGFQKVLQKRTTIFAMEELQELLLSVERRLSFNLEPLPELFLQLAAQREADDTSFLFQLVKALREGEDSTVSEAWRQTLDMFSQEKRLCDEAKSLMLSIGKELGTTDYETESAKLRRGAELMKEYIKREKKDLLQSEKTFKSLGILSGICIVIILI